MSSSPHGDGLGRPPPSPRTSPRSSPTGISPSEKSTRGESYLPRADRGQPRKRNENGRDLFHAHQYALASLLHNAVVDQLRQASQDGVEWKDRYISMLMYREIAGKNKGDPIFHRPTSKSFTGVRPRSASSSRSSSGVNVAKKKEPVLRKSRVDGYVESVTKDSKGGVTVTVLCKYKVSGRSWREKRLRCNIDQLIEASTTIASMFVVPLKGTLTKRVSEADETNMQSSRREKRTREKRESSGESSEVEPMEAKWKRGRSRRGRPRGKSDGESPTDQTSVVAFG